MDNSFNLISTIRTILKWKVPIIVFVLLASAVSVVVSYMMPNYYQSNTVFYPTNPMITDSKVLFSGQGRDRGLDYFGTKEDANRMLSIGKSIGTAEYIMNKYKLAERYDIDTTDKEWRFKMRREFEGNYTIIKTEYGALEVTMMDKDPQVAADMCRDILQRVDDQNIDIILSKKKTILGIYEEKLIDTKREVELLADSLATLILNHNIKQVESVDGKNIIIKGDDPRMIEVFRVLKKNQESAVRDLNHTKILYDQFSVSTSNKVSSVFVVEEAFPSVKKVKPIRWLICVSSFLVATFLAIFGALLAEQIQYIRQELAND